MSLSRTARRISLPALLAVVLAAALLAIAAGRRLVTLVFYGLRDGQIRCLPRTPEDAPPLPPAQRA